MVDRLHARVFGDKPLYVENLFDGEATLRTSGWPQTPQPDVLVAHIVFNRVWDMSIRQLITKTFPNLRRLRLRYIYCIPDAHDGVDGRESSLHGLPTSLQTLFVETGPDEIIYVGDLTEFPNLRILGIRHARFLPSGPKFPPHFQWLLTNHHDSHAAFPNVPACPLREYQGPIRQMLWECFRPITHPVLYNICNPATTPTIDDILLHDT